MILSDTWSLNSVKQKNALSANRYCYRQTYTMAMDENVPEECPGVGTEQSGKASACDGCPNQKICASAGPAPPDPDIDIIAERLSGVKHKILILSGEVKIDDVGSRNVEIGIMEGASWFNI